MIVFGSMLAEASHAKIDAPFDSNNSMAALLLFFKPKTVIFLSFSSSVFFIAFILRKSYKK